MNAFSIFFVLVIFIGPRRKQVVAFEHIPAKCSFREIATHATPPWSSFETPQPRPAPEQGALIDGLKKMNTVMSSEFFTKSPVLKQFYTKFIKMVDVRESSISGAGLGLFAKKAIKANTIISFYPVHALGYNIDQPFVTSNPDDESYFQATPTSQSVYLHCTDQPIFRRVPLIAKQSVPVPVRETNLETDVPPLFLDVNPNRKVMDGWVSHIINDGAAMMSPISSTQGNDMEQSMMEYYQASKAKKNCIHIPFGPSPIIATVTTKKIGKDEELFTTYGGVYWLGVSFPHVNNFEITPLIQSEINGSAQDLFKCMKIVSELYGNQITALQSEFDSLSR